MNKSTIILFAVITIVMSSCAPQIYQSPDAESRAASHQTIAILPPKVAITTRTNTNAEAIREMQNSESMIIQQEMYSWLLRRKMRNRIVVDVQDPSTTNAKLDKAGYFDRTPLSPAEMAEILGVDAVVTSHYSLSQPLSDVEAVALGVLVGYNGPTNRATVSLEIHDKTTEKVLWNYNDQIEGSLGSSHAWLVDNLMRSASRRMPYYNR